MLWILWENIFIKVMKKSKKDMLMSFSIGTGGDAGFPLKQLNKIGSGLEASLPCDCGNGAVRRDKELFCHLQTVCGYILVKGLAGGAFQRLT